jgi:hypothetical protein
MNRENPLSPPNPGSDFCGSAGAQQRFSKSVPTSGSGCKNDGLNQQFGPALLRWLCTRKQALTRLASSLSGGKSDGHPEKTAKQD